LSGGALRPPVRQDHRARRRAHAPFSAWHGFVLSLLVFNDTVLKAHVFNGLCSPGRERGIPMEIGS